MVYTRIIILPLFMMFIMWQKKSQICGPSTMKIMQRYLYNDNGKECGQGDV